jgi:rhodanese-related sulfurtransferase
MPGSHRASARRWLSDDTDWQNLRVEPLIPIPSAPVTTVAAALADGTARYLDCRSEQEYAVCIVPDSINICFPHNGNREPISEEEFLQDVLDEGFEKDELIYVGCRKGPRSAMACEVLVSKRALPVIDSIFWRFLFYRETLSTFADQRWLHGCG